MTVKIKDSKGNVVGTSESISITTKDEMETYQSADIVRDDQGNFVSSKSVGEPIQLIGELLIEFELVNPTIHLNTLEGKYTIEATQGYLNETKFDNYLLKLGGCEFYNSLSGKAYYIELPWIYKMNKELLDTLDKLNLKDRLLLIQFLITGYFINKLDQLSKALRKYDYNN